MDASSGPMLHLVHDGAMVFAICVLVKVELDQVAQQQRLPCDRMPLVLHDIGDCVHNVLQGHREEQESTPRQERPVLAQVLICCSLLCCCDKCPLAGTHHDGAIVGADRLLEGREGDGAAVKWQPLEWCPGLVLVPAPLCLPFCGRQVTSVLHATSHAASVNSTFHAARICGPQPAPTFCRAFLLAMVPGCAL